MKALILNSGLGKRMGTLTGEQPKCMTEIAPNETILSRQLRQLAEAGIRDVVITTGPYSEVVARYCSELGLPLRFAFVKNPDYETTNYIYSIYCAREYLMDSDILLMHGDLVLEGTVMDMLMECESSSLVVSSTQALPEKDFKAVVRNGKVACVGVNFFSNAIAAQPLYKLRQSDWQKWMDAIVMFCESGNRTCYAEDAFNEIAETCHITPLDVHKRLCSEIDTPEDLAVVSAKLRELSQKTVYMCFSTDVLHSAHIALIAKAKKLGKLIIGVLSDEAIASYKRFPLIPFEERASIFKSLSGVYDVIEQKTLSHSDVLQQLRPDYVVHGDNWKAGFQKPIRDEVVSILATYGGQLIEYPYSKDEKFKAFDERAKARLSMPDIRRGRLRKLLEMKPCLSIMEAHSGLTALIVENTKTYENGEIHQFDGIWVSSLCDSMAKGKPDIEVVDMSSRLRTIDDIMEVSTKPIILDGDTGGQIEHFVYTVRTLERIGVSAVIIEDKTGLKQNSLLGTDVQQTQDSIENFSAKIAAGKNAQKTKEFMIIARIESLILEQGIEDALTRAFAFTAAGADGIMIHSRKKQPDEIFEFIAAFRQNDPLTPIVVVPSTFNTVTEAEFAARGVNIVIYANQLIRSALPAMRKTAETILKNHRAKEADAFCMPIKEAVSLISES